MTVPVQTIFTASTANGVTTVFPYSFKITDEEDLAVTVDGVLQTSGYTVSGVGSDTGGNVTFSVAPANGLSVVRYLAPILKREEDYQQFGDWLADVVNRDFDRLWLALQAKNQDTSRSIKLPVDTADDQTIEQDAATRAGKFISFDSYGNVTLSVLADLTTLSAVSAFMETLLDDATASAACATLGARQESDDVRLAAGKKIIAEGVTDDAYETSLEFSDPTADRTITIPNASGTMALYRVVHPVAKIETFMRTTAPDGWLEANGGTIGDAISGATLRANADAQELYESLWADFDNTALPIQDSTGTATTRGASAAADFAAHKRLPVHDLRGHFLRGWDHGRGTADTGRTLGSAQADQNKSHTHALGPWPHSYGSGASDTSEMWGGGGSLFNNLTSATGASGGTEVRVLNTAVLVCISY